MSIEQLEQTIAKIEGFIIAITEVYKKKKETLNLEANSINQVASLPFASISKESQESAKKCLDEKLKILEIFVNEETQPLVVLHDNLKKQLACHQEIEKLEKQGSSMDENPVVNTSSPKHEGKGKEEAKEPEKGKEQKLKADQPSKLEDRKQELQRLESEQKGLTTRVSNLWNIRDLMISSNMYELRELSLNILKLGIASPERAKVYLATTQQKEATTLAELKANNKKYLKTTNISTEESVEKGGSSKGTDLHYDRTLKNDSVRVEVKATGTQPYNGRNSPEITAINKCIMDAEHQHKSRLSDDAKKTNNTWYKTVVTISPYNPAGWPYTPTQFDQVKKTGFNYDEIKKMAETELNSLASEKKHVTPKQLNSTKMDMTLTAWDPYKEYFSNLRAAALWNNPPSSSSPLPSSSSPLPSSSSSTSSSSTSSSSTSSSSSSSSSSSTSSSSSSTLGKKRKQEPEEPSKSSEGIITPANKQAKTNSQSKETSSISKDSLVKLGSRLTVTERVTITNICNTGEDLILDRVSGNEFVGHWKNPKLNNEPIPLRRHWDIEKHTGNTELHDFALDGNLKSAEAFLSRKYKRMNAVKTDGQLIPVIKGTTTQVDIINSLNVEGNTPLHLAVLGKQEKMVEFLCKQQEIDVNKQNRQGNTPLHLAVKMNNVDMVDLLCKHQGIDVTIQNGETKTPLQLIEKEGEQIRELIGKANKTLPSPMEVDTSTDKIATTPPSSIPSGISSMNMGK